jgi:hypothetical protein
VVVAVKPPPCPDCGAGHGRDLALIHGDGCPVGAALDAMREADRAWFDTHPGADHYYRPLMPGDLGMATLASVIHAGRVLVRRLGPGVRARVLPDDLLLAPGLDAERLLAVVGTAAELHGGWLAALEGEPT